MLGFKTFGAVFGFLNQFHTPNIMLVLQFCSQYTQ